MADQAKCDRCEIRYVWNPKILPENVDEIIRRQVRGRPTLLTRNIRIGIAACPICGHLLVPTNGRCKYTVKGSLPITHMSDKAVDLRMGNIERPGGSLR